MVHVLQWIMWWPAAFKGVCKAGTTRAAGIVLGLPGGTKPILRAPPPLDLVSLECLHDTLVHGLHFGQSLQQPPCSFADGAAFQPHTVISEMFVCWSARQSALAVQGFGGGGE